ncbi:rRNA-processing protein PWP1 Ecym_4717 [Eremothecium cymbalariae DBVPG|uniref:Uncharacterized protein n=1 Tax=Eremothecium cymbalariae (strain CBS 270.75 / DBVPG 7215 / KCTC 17166 / NRRL Y-17582) TaxID=931890 RepID=G8JSL5_ERECY|nr:hypothetical protein Ecym_4717 [Eremothecium cymbalariae DBVPG\
MKKVFNRRFDELYNTVPLVRSRKLYPHCSAMISSTSWVPRGFPSEFPEQYELDDEEMERINKLAQLNLDDAKQDLSELNEEVQVDAEAALEALPDSEELKNQLDFDDDLKHYDLEHYDDDGEVDGEDISMFPGLSREAKYHKGDEGNDPYISLPKDSDLLKEKMELQIYPTDNMILATRTEDDISYLDVYVYDDGAGFHDDSIPVEEGDEMDPDVARGLIRDSSLYVHHDLMLPAFPLCVEWINYKPSTTSENIGNFAAIGTFDPAIEIWNLDCVDKAFPDMILGEPVNGGTKISKKKKGKKQHITTHHTDAVLSLSHNKQYRVVLASTSADQTIKLWDLNQGTAVRSIASIHNGTTVSSSQWHPSDGSIILTGAYDSRVALSDVRISNDSEMSKYWSVMTGEEVECVSFVNDNEFLAGTDSGNIYSFDLRNGEKSSPLWTLKAHDSGISSMNVNSFIPNMMVSSAMGEKVIKLWKIPTDQENSTQKGPSMVLSRDFGVGNVLTTSFAPDIEVTGNIVVGGTSPGLKLWDVFTNRSVRKTFASGLKDVQTTAKEEARQLGRSSRISRKYMNNNNPDTVINVDDVAEEEEDHKGTDDGDWEDEE